MRRACVVACRDANLDVGEVATKPGGDHATPPGIQLAESALDVVTTIDGPDTAETRELLEKLRTALSVVRAHLPSLPFGVTLQWEAPPFDPDRRLLAFRVWDPPEEIERGFAALLNRETLLDGEVDDFEAGKREATVWGWDRDRQRWLAV